LRQLEDAYSFIKQEADELREKLRRQESEITNLRQELREEERRFREG
jgi:predicted  nucleic acid-binding Zn-ribbon protein